MIVSAFQFEPRFLDAEGNADRMEECMSRVVSDLYLFPELSLSGYSFSSMRDLAAATEGSAGDTFDRFTAIARSTDAAIVYGFVERAGDRYYNAAVFITPAGVSGVYRKVHLYGEEKIWFQPGDAGFPAFKWKETTFGIMICYDWRFPEAARSLMLRGAEVLLHPSNLVTPERIWGPMLRTRAVENKVYLVTADRIGTERQGNKSISFAGCSRIISYNGDILAELGPEEEGILTATIDPSKVRSKSLSEWNDILADRRPDMYVR